MIVAVINQKGGAGAMAEAGGRVLLIDADRQQTAQDWAAVCEGQPAFQVIGLSKPVLHRDLPAMAADYDHVVIDGAPGITRSPDL